MKLNSTKLNYLFAGMINTLFGYFSSLGIYSLIDKGNLIQILILSNIISITFSYLNYKILVFKTKDNWLKEYIKCIMTYGISGILSITLSWILIDSFEFKFWKAQLISISIIAISSFFLHKNFTFKKV